LCFIVCTKFYISAFAHNLMSCLLLMYRHARKELKAIAQREKAREPEPVNAGYERPDKKEAVALFEARHCGLDVV
jgi:hypothetical protein